MGYGSGLIRLAWRVALFCDCENHLILEGSGQGIYGCEVA